MTTRSYIFTRLGIFLAFSSSILFRPFYALPANSFYWAIGILLLSVSMISLSTTRQQSFRWFNIILTLSAAGLCFVFPTSWWPAFLLLVFSGLSAMLPHAIFARLSAGTAKSGLALLVGNILLKQASVIQTMFDMDYLSAIFSNFIGRLFGSQVSVVANNLVLQTPEEALPFSLAPEWTGFYLRLVAFIMLLGWLWIKPSVSHKSKLLRYLWAIPLYIVLAQICSAFFFVGQSMVATMLNSYEYPWNPLYQIIIALPSALIAISLAGNPHKEIAGQLNPNRQKENWPAWSSAFVCFLLLGGGLIFEDPGNTKAGRVMIDDGHSDWEWAGEAMNTRQFGTKTTYNYHGLGKLLSRYYETSINNQDLSPELLSNVDVLILKTPTRPYSPEEQTAILDFVRAGGGLYVISDHTDVFGMSTFVNELTENFGFTYNKDTVFDILSTKDQFWPGQDELLHPANIHLDYYRYLTGCSIKPTLGCEVVMQGPQTGSDLLSYSTSNFFDTYYPRTELRFGNLVQLVASRYGKGRIVGFSDSTTYSNFAMFLPGRLEHLISIIEFLNRQNSAFPWKILSLLLGLGFAYLARVKGLGRDEMLSAALPAILIIVPASHWFAEANYPFPETVHPHPTCSLDMRYSEIVVPTVNKLDHEAVLNMETFYVWLYRSGRIPELNAGKIAETTELHTIINPVKAPTADDVQDLDDFMKRGGTLLIAGRPGNINMDVNNWLSKYDIGFDKQSFRDTTVVHPEHKVPIFVDLAQAVHGGLPDYRIQFGPVVSSTVKVGKGKLIVSGLADCFNNSHLGRYDSIPSDLSYEYLQMYYRHTGMKYSGEIQIDNSFLQ
jgi:hypothetical protein